MPVPKVTSVVRDGRPPRFAVGCKVGTMPAVVIFDRRCRYEVGRKVRLRYWGHGEKWFHGTIRNIDPIRVDLI